MEYELLKLYAHPNDPILDYFTKKIDKINSRGVILEVIPSNETVLEGDDVYMDEPELIINYIETGSFYDNSNYEEVRQSQLGSGGNKKVTASTPTDHSDNSEEENEEAVVSPKAMSEVDQKIIDNMLYQPSY